MKKKKILSAFAALAVAISAITPVTGDLGLSFVSDAVLVESGGISAAVLPGDDPESLSYLEKDQEFDVKVTIPEFVHKFDTLQIKVVFDASAFEYQTGDDSDWDDSADVLSVLDSVGIDNASEKAADAYCNVEEAADGSKKGTLTMTLSGSDNSDPWPFEMTQDIVLKARMKVISNIGKEYFFTIDKENTFITYNAGVTEAADDKIEIWAPETDKVSVHIANSFGAIIEGYDFSEGDLYVSLTTDAAGTTPATLNNGTVISPVKVDPTDGSFLFKVMPEDKSSYLILDKWCVFVDFEKGGGSANPIGVDVQNQVECGYTVNNDYTISSKAIIPGSLYIRKEAGTFNVRMFGDVDDTVGIQASDATRILNHVVGRTPFEDDLDIAMANVLQDGKVNALDATQILRKVVGLAKNSFAVHTKND